MILVLPTLLLPIIATLISAYLRLGDLWESFLRSSLFYKIRRKDIRKNK